MLRAVRGAVSPADRLTARPVRNGAAARPCRPIPDIPAGAAILLSVRPAIKRVRPRPVRALPRPRPTEERVRRLPAIARPATRPTQVRPPTGRAAAVPPANRRLSRTPSLGRVEKKQFSILT